MSNTPTDNAWLDELFDTFLSNVYADSVDESSTVRAVVKREVASAFMKSAKAHIASQVSSAVVEAEQNLALRVLFFANLDDPNAINDIRTLLRATLNVNTKDLKDE